MTATFLTALFLLAGQDGVVVLGAVPAQGTAMPSASVDEALDDPALLDGASPSFWASTEYLLWWTRKAPLPVPLVTQGSPTGMFPGALNQPGTTVLYGGQGVNFSPASGYRVSAGLLLLPDAGLWLEGSWLMLEKQSRNFSVSSDANGNPIFAQPIFDAATGMAVAEPVSIPNPFGVAGGILVSNTSRLQGWDVNLGLAGWSSGNSRLVLLGGFRSLDLLESLTVDTTFRDVSGVPGGAGLFFQGNLSTNPATQFTTEDRFRASNIFYGGQLGGRFMHQLGIFSLSAQAKVALGQTNEIVTISGSSSAITPGQATVTAPGGVLALPSNIGRHYRSQFAVVPEGTFSLGVQLAPWLRASVGYNILYWSAVARPGNQIDLNVNRFQVPTSGFFGLGAGPARPAFNFQNSDYWAQGINFGLQFTY